MKRTAIVLAAIGVLWAVLALPATATDSNQVGYWCETGVKYEPVDTPFVVPEPPAGEVWTLLVLKAGSGEGENAEFVNPTVGVGYEHPSGKDISHAILCHEGGTVDTTTTTMATTTTGPSGDTTTTEPPTTTTVPETSTTTTSSTSTSTTTSSTTQPPSTTTTSEATTTTLGTTTSTTEPNSTTTSSTTPTSSSSTTTTGTPKGGVATGGGGTALPHTGLEMAEWLALAVLLLGGGALLLAGTWRIVGSDN